MDLEIQSLVENQTWVLVPRHESCFIISGRWMFKIKYGLDRRIIKYKASPRAEDKKLLTCSSIKPIEKLVSKSQLLSKISKRVKKFGLDSANRF